MKTINVETPNGTKPKENWKKKAEKAVKQRAETLKEDPKALQKVAAFVIFFGAITVEGLVLFANLSPYMKASNVLIAKALELNTIVQSALKPIGWIVGTAGLCAVQFGEIYPLLLKSPNTQKYAKASSIALIAYAIDSTLAVSFWPPLKVSLLEFVQTPLMGNINWLNIIIILVTLFGGEAIIRLNKTLGETF